MSLEKVNEEIKDDAEHRAKEILHAAKQTVREIKQTAEANVKKLEQTTEEHLQEIKKQLSLKGQVAINLETKKLFFEAKKEVLDDIFTKAEGKTNNLEKKKKEELLKILIKRASQELAIATVYSNAQDAKILEKQGNFNIRVTPEIKAGFIVENATATIRIDYTFTTLFEHVRIRALQNVAAIIE